MEFFENLPFMEQPIIESEEHVLTECPYYHPLRVSLSENLKSLFSHDEGIRANHDFATHEQVWKIPSGLSSTSQSKSNKGLLVFFRMNPQTWNNF
jgi:hypothetical protein